MSLKNEDFKSYLHSIDRSELLAIALDLNVPDLYIVPTEDLIDECASRLAAQEAF